MVKPSDGLAEPQSLVRSLVELLRNHGDTVVLQAGDTPRLVTPTRQIQLGTRALPLAVVHEVLDHVLPREARWTFGRRGVVRCTLHRRSGVSSTAYTVVATQERGLRLEICRARARPTNTNPSRRSVNTRASSRPGKPLVLLIDDSVDQLDLYELALSDRYRVLQAQRGEAGIELAVTHQPDAIVVDLGLPGIDGWEVCRRLHAHRSTASIPVVILTALDGEYLQHEAACAGVAGFLTKPCRFDTLQERLESVIALDPTM